jgi:hypothetical protein
VDLSVDINIVLGMPWMANLGSILWNFASLEIWFQQGDRTVTFTVPSGQASQMVLTLPVPLLPRQRRRHSGATTTAASATTTIIAATLQPDQCH